MCDVLDRIEEKGRKQGLKEGHKAGLEKGEILGVIRTGKMLGWTEEEFIENLMKLFAVTEEAAKNLMFRESV